MISVIIERVNNIYNTEETGENKTAPKKFKLITFLTILTLAYIGFLLYQAVYLNYQTNKKISSLRREIQDLDADRESLEALIAYYQTPAFQELEARKKLGMRMPGEKVIQVKLTQTPVTTKQEDKISIQTGSANYQKWLDFICGNYK